MRLRPWGLVLLVGLMVGVGPLAAQDTGREPKGDATATAESTSTTTGALLDFLHYVPDTASNRTFLTYGDKAAWLQSWNIPNAPTFDAVEALDEQARQRWMMILPRQTLAPNALALQYLATGDDMKYYGFDYFQTDRYMEAGQPPNMITVVDGQFDAATINAALTKLTYKASPLTPEGTLYSLRDDYQTDMSADLPTIGKLATRNRIALIGDRMLIAGGTPTIEAALAAQGGTAIKSLADAPEYQATVAALNDPALADVGPLMGVFFTGDPVVSDPALLAGGRLTPEQLKEIQSRFADQPKLPPYVLSAFSSHHANGKTSLVLTLVFSANTDAMTAAQDLGERIQQYVSLRTNRPFLQTIHATFDRAFALEANGLPVAMLVLTADDPGPDSTVVPDWSQAIFARDLGFLASN